MVQLWTLSPALEHLPPARAEVWVKRALVCVPYIAVNNFYCHNDRSWDVRDGRNLPVDLGLSLYSILISSVKAQAAPGDELSRRINQWRKLTR